MAPDELGVADVAGYFRQTSPISSVRTCRERNLRGASLCCDFRMARLEGADFSDTDPWSSIFDFATSDSSTTWPPGFEPDDEDMVDYDADPGPTSGVERRPTAIRAAVHRARRRRAALQRSGRHTAGMVNE